MDTSGLRALDDPVGESLRGHHAHLARVVGSAATYQQGVATFVAIDPDDPRRWDDVAQLLGPGGFADMFSAPHRPPPGWGEVFRLDGRQMLHVDPVAAPAADVSGEIVELGLDDLPEILDLIALTRPGPFGPRTLELGTYLGVRDRDVLVAMAGERLHPPGWTEISAVCTAPQARGRGLSARLITALIGRIESRGERPFLHVADTNSAAIAVYERLGFRTRAQVSFRGYRVPDA